ncbi:hypothetical protein MMC20_006007 [Loxospora ochrophaea]|nr:hypothetical protein [Loxospora ochrophaea]
MSPSARNPGGPVPSPKPEDKDSTEWRKKQALATGPVLPMTYDNAATYGMTESLFTSLKDIFEAILATQSRIGVVSPHKFLEVLRRENEMFRTSMHQDAHEFLNLLLNEVVANVEDNSKRLDAQVQTNGSTDKGMFEKALAAAATTMPNMTGSRTPTNTRWVHELFEGILTSETKCLTCENVSQRDEAFLDLSVDLDQHSSVTSCLRKFSEEEMLCERNKFHCDRCGGLQEAEKRMKIKRLPKILALHLKRFKYTEDLQRLQKLFHRVVYPYHLRLFNTTDDAEDPDRLYELYAVVVHIGGGPYHGHYVAIVKTEDRGWLLFDDELVEPVDKSFVRNFFGERPGLACAYVLFYQETTFEAVKREQEAEGIVATATTQTVGSPTRESVGLGLKTNGIAPHLPQSSVSPISEDNGDRWENLDKAATTPISPSFPTPNPSSITPAISTPIMQGLSTKKSDVQSKKERAKEEKERKAAEKEAEKAERVRKKNLEVKRKEIEKKQAAEIKAAIEASKASKVEEDRRLAQENGNGAAAASPQPTNPVAGGLNRFRQSSKSLRHKPLFWSSKESSSGSKTEAARDDSAVEEREADDRLGTSLPTSGIQGQVDADKEKEKKSRFSLRKKTSSLLT